MKRPIFQGAGVALVTPMKEDFSVNYQKLRELVSFQIEQGSQAIITCGTTGESCTLDHDEHCEVMRVTIDEAAGRVPVIAGTGSNDTRYCVSLSQQAEQMGADGLLLITPYYNKTSQRGLVEHFRTVAEAVSLPMIVYSLKSRTGLNVEPETCYELAKIKNVVGLKEANGDFSQNAKIRQLCGDDLALYSGNDDQIVPLLSLGGVGVISVVSNILPRETQEICSLYFAGRVEESMRLQLKLLDLINNLFIDVNPIPVKEAMNLMGLAVGDCRLPLYRMSDAAREQLRQSLLAHGLIA